MKKIAAFLLALCFTAPTLLIACKSQSESADNAESSSLPESSYESSLEDSSVSSSPQESIPPEETEPPAPPAPPAVQKAQYIKCTADRVNLRSGAGTGFAVLGSAEEGTMYAVIGKTGNWYKTYYKNQTAYFYASYATVFSLKKTSNEVESVIEEGYKLLGVPYVYGAVRLHDGKGRLLGGFTAQKFDCSSLIQYVFYKGAGTLLGVHTRSQVLQGEYVAKSDLQRGDCIFFTNEQRQYNKGIERVGHVALYLGDGYILHTASDYARIEKISQKRWSFYIEARRFL